MSDITSRTFVLYVKDPERYGSTLREWVRIGPDVFELEAPDEHAARIDDIIRLMVSPLAPKDKMIWVGKRGPHDTEEEWLKHCAVITNVKEPE